jgi:hypothetical protein
MFLRSNSASIFSESGLSARPPGPVVPSVSQPPSAIAAAIADAAISVRTKGRRFNELLPDQ